jgi:hypothetical protein
MACWLQNTDSLPLSITKKSYLSSALGFTASQSSADIAMGIGNFAYEYAYFNMSSIFILLL